MFIFFVGGLCEWHSLALKQELPPLKLMYTKIDASGERDLFSAPEVNNQYIVPVHFPLLYDRVDYIIDTGASITSIPLSLYNKGITNNKPTGQKVEITGVGGSAGMGDVILLEYIEIGNIKLTDVEAVICEKCPPLLGQNVLKRLNLRTQNRDGKNFLIISH
ncbi:MAG: retroviral-like aspartic protease family protein [Proteobacteria bacterium]|nr:retroviral-like aspartic protease family protein [Pseudomonadota bacterium]